MSGKRAALIVATGQYKDRRLAALEGPARDAEALRTVLANKEIGGFDVRIALNSRVETLRRTLETFFADRARDDLLLVHFSGHGLKDDDGQLYLAAADTQLDRLLSTAIDAAWVNRMMNRCRSERIALFLDCCFAGAFTSGMIRRSGPDTAGVKDHFGGSGIFVIAASDAMQYSFESGRQIGATPEPSPFTGALVDGLASGEADRDEDGFVSIDELFDYLEDRIRRTSPSQTPTKSAFNQVGEWVIARSTRQPSIRLLPADLQAQIRSEDVLDRFGALIGLRDLAAGPDPRVGEAARDALRRLAQDDSRKVAATAERILAELPEHPRTGRASRRTAAVEPVEPAPSEPIEIEPPTPEPQPAAADIPPFAAVPISAAAPVMPAPAAPIVAPQPQIAVPTSIAPAPTGAIGVAPPRGREPAATGWMQPVAEPRRPGPSRPADWSAGRAVVRVAIGTFLWAMFVYGWYLSANPWILQDPSTLDPLTSAFSTTAAVLTVGTTLVVVLAERFVPAMRLPVGAFYRVVGGSRWASAVLLGALIGWLVGSIVQAMYDPTSPSSMAIGAQSILCGGVAFLFAEFLASRWFGAPSPAAAA